MRWRRYSRGSGVPAKTRNVCWLMFPFSGKSCTSTGCASWKRDERRLACARGYSSLCVSALVTRLSLGLPRVRAHRTPAPTAGQCIRSGGYSGALRNVHIQASVRQAGRPRFEGEIGRRPPVGPAPTTREDEHDSSQQTSGLAPRPGGRRRSPCRRRPRHLGFRHRPPRPGRRFRFPPPPRRCRRPLPTSSPP